MQNRETNAEQTTKLLIMTGRTLIQKRICYISYKVISMFAELLNYGYSVVTMVTES